jgi:hypothetical protein
MRRLTLSVAALAVLAACSKTTPPVPAVAVSGSPVRGACGPRLQYDGCSY